MAKWWFVTALAVLLATPSFVLGACPNKCSGHGKCGLNDVCDCLQNWIGGDCSGRQCPFTRAWHDTAQRDDDAHYFAECGNRGSCDRTSGECTCDSGFVGSGCRRMQCPNDCSGHGTCEFIEELASDDYHKRIGGDKAVTYELWDQEKIMGCVCDGGFEGHDCSLRTCPKGDDPLTPSQFDMIQAVVVTVTAAGDGEGYLTYHDPYGNSYTTETFVIKDPKALPATKNDEATCANIQQALRRLPNNVLNMVTVDDAERFYALKRADPADPKGRATPYRVFNDDNVVGSNLKWSGKGTKNKVICLVSFTSEPGTTGFQHLLDCDVAAHANDKGQQPKSDGVATGSCKVHEVYPLAVYVGVDTIAVGDTVGDGDLTNEQLSETKEISRPLTELTECSGRGTCDYSTGTCTCFAGHMGLACQKQEALV